MKLLQLLVQLFVIHSLRNKTQHLFIMKKNLFTVASICLLSLGASAQYDLEVNLVSPASAASATGTNNFVITYSVTNNGPNAVAAGDTLYLALLHSDNNYSIANGAAGSVSLVVLPAAIPSGSTLNSQTVGLNATANLTGINGPVCLFVTVGNAGFTTIEGDPNDTDMDNNVDCFTSVPASASIAEEQTLTVVAFPNPASEILNLSIEGDVITSVSILGLDGKVISTNTGTSAQLDSLSAGMYVYEATTESGTVLRNTFIKK